MAQLNLLLDTLNGKSPSGVQMPGTRRHTWDEINSNSAGARSRATSRDWPGNKLMCPYQFPFHLTFRKLSTAILFYYNIRSLFICALLYFLCKFTNYFPVYLVSLCSPHPSAFAFVLGLWQLGVSWLFPVAQVSFLWQLATGKWQVATGDGLLQLIAGIATKQKSFWQPAKVWN